MCEFSLSDQQKALQGLAREFASKEVRPAAKALDGEPDLSRRFPWEVFEQASKLGLRTLGLPPGEGGPGLDLLTHCLVFEELAYGDVGFATTLEPTWRQRRLLTLKPAALPAFRDDERALLALVATDGNGNRPITSQRQASQWLLDGQSDDVVAGEIPAR